jgi:SAM-dependent methyltransferase
MTSSQAQPQSQFQDQAQSLPPSFFEALYAADADPWKFATSEYEANKYAATIAALPRPRYQSAFEIGGAIGVLTQQLAQRCDALLSVDVCQVAQEQAIQRCQHLPQVRFELMCVPQQFPDRLFDLILVSEVGYYWCWEDLQLAQREILEHLQPGGQLLLVHWTVDAKVLPLTGDQVHEAFLKLDGSSLRHLCGQQTAQYRLDLFERAE